MPVMKTLILVSFFLACPSVKAQVDTAYQLGYFPLGDHDLWEYSTESSDESSGNSHGGYSVEVVGDTALPDGYIYKNVVRRDAYTLQYLGTTCERIDSSTGTVYQYSSSWLNLFGAGGVVQFPGYSLVTNGTQVELGVETQVQMVQKVLGYMNASDYWIAQGFGIVLDAETSPSSYYQEALVYCKIDGVSYGDSLRTSLRTAPPLPTEYALYQNYPNPFNPSTTISYQILTGSQVILKVFDVLGREVRTLVNQQQQAGSYAVKLNGANLPSGVYFCRLEAGTYHDVKKMLLLK